MGVHVSNEGVFPCIVPYVPYIEKPGSPRTSAFDRGTELCELLAYTPHLRPIPLAVYICRRYHTGSHPRYSSLLGACERSLVHRLHCLPLQAHALCGTSIEVKVDIHNTMSSHQSVQLLGVVVWVLISASVYAGHWIL